MPNSVAIVTGASQGIGKATALRLARDFSGLALVARNEAHLQETAQQAKSVGAESLVLPLDLIGDYKSNVELYPKFQEFFRQYQPPTLAVWGKNDPFFIPAGAEAFRRDIPGAQVKMLDTGHFALETHVVEIAAEMKKFFGANGI